MNEPCYYCGVNAWTSCKHRKGVEKPKPLANPPVDSRSLYKPKPGEGNGRNFKTKRGDNHRKYWRLPNDE